MNSAFTSPQQLFKYPNGDIRIVTYQNLSEGDKLEFTDLRGDLQEGIISEIKENRKSMGSFIGEIPKSYRLHL